MSDETMAGARAPQAAQVRASGGIPTIGRIVIFHEGDATFGGDRDHPGRFGSRDHPAIITRVWSDVCVNLTVFHSDGTIEGRPSILLSPELPEGCEDANSNWRWPERPDPAPPTPPLPAADAE